MAKKRQPKQPFMVEGMTVSDIIKLGDDVISKMNQRDLSRALRTIALAANKRLNRLKKKAEVSVNEHGDVTYTDISGQGLDFEALYFTSLPNIYHNSPLTIVKIIGTMVAIAVVVFKYILL